MSVLALAAALLLQSPSPLRDVETKYQVATEVLQQTLDWKGDGYVVHADPPKETQMAAYVPTFVKEWSLYPADLPKRLRLKKIVFGVNMAVDGQLRAAVPAFDGDTMYYDPVRGATSSHYQRIVLHHELFHMIDQRMGKLDKDREWIALNAKEFRYGSGGAKMQVSGVGELTDTLPGFLTPYSTAAIEEDKAELFAHAVVDGPVVAERIKKDSILAKKLALLKSRLEAFDAGFGAVFWNQIEGWKPPLGWSGSFWSNEWARSDVVGA